MSRKKTMQIRERERMFLELNVLLLLLPAFATMNKNIDLKVLRIRCLLIDFSQCQWNEMYLQTSKFV